MAGESAIITFLLIVHGLVGVALLGAITHQTASLFRRKTLRTGSFIDRYTGVSQRTFTYAVVYLYVFGLVVGAIIYPSYRLNVRIPFDEMSMGWAVGLFEIKEHFAGIGLGTLPFYVSTWREGSVPAQPFGRRAVTILLAFIVWWDFLVGHVLNNIRGLA